MSDIKLIRVRRWLVSTTRNPSVWKWGVTCQSCGVTDFYWTWSVAIASADSHVRAHKAGLRYPRKPSAGLSELDALTQRI